MWGIPYALYNFYLSLYMKAQGITDQQIGYLISIGFISGAIFSLFGGAIVNYLGRKRTLLISDLIAWPSSLVIYMLANQFWIFALASICNSVVRIASISFTLMMVEDADDDQRKAAFTLLNIVNIFSGVFTPLAGLLVGNLGIIPAERILMAVAVVSMSTMMISRHHYYEETQVGKEILKERQEKKISADFRFNLFGNAFGYLKKKPSVFVVMSVLVLFNIYLPIGTINSLYFAPYLTEVLKQDKSLISLLGGVNSLTIVMALIFLLPHLKQGLFPLLTGLLLQILSLLVLIFTPTGSFLALVMVIILYALGFGLFRPLIDTLFAEVTEGKERAGLYGLSNTLVSIFSASAGLFSGKIYNKAPVSIYIFSLLILLLCLGGLLLYAFLEKKPLFPRIKLPRRRRDSKQLSRI
jgi:MFS family permease